MGPARSLLQILLKLISMPIQKTFIAWQEAGCRFNDHLIAIDISYFHATIRMIIKRLR